MYTEHEPSNGGDGKPEFMKIEFGIAMIPFLKFDGGCDGCKAGARMALSKLSVMAMAAVAKSYIALMEEARGECKVELMDEEAVKDILRDTLGDELADKFMEFANGRI